VPTHGQVIRTAVVIAQALFNTGLTVSGYVNFTAAVILWASMVPVALVALFWPRMSPLVEKAKRIRLRWPVYVPPTEAELARERENQRFGQAVVEREAPGASQEVARLEGEIERLRAWVPQPNDEDLAQRCCELSAEIFEFYKSQRENLVKTLQSGHGAFFLKGSEKSEWRSEETERQEKWMVDRYSEQFGGPVSALCDDIETRGWCTPEERNRFENPTEPQDIRYAAQRLNAICRRSGYEPQESPTRQKQPQFTEDLRQRSCKLSTELSELIGRWQNAVDGALQPGAINQARYGIEGDPDRSLEIKSHDNWLMEQYGERFGREMLELSDELSRQEYITTEIRKRLESPATPQDIQHIAQRLKIICGEPD
jgi:hypothetical protein